MHNEAIKMAKWAMTDACAKGYDNMTSQDWDDFKDCVETAKNAIKCDYYYRLVECMKKDEEEEKREDAYFLDMLKDEYKDEYKRMKEEYGEEDGERRFYDNYRYANGRFAPKGSGTYRPRSSGRRGRRGYEEMPYMMMPEMYDDYNAERMRDLDRHIGKLYYTSMGGNGGNSNSGGSSSGSNSGGSMRGYEDGFNEGSRRGYEDGYNDGRRSNSGSRSRDGREGRSGQSRRTYMETKEMNKGNTPEEKRQKMTELEKYMGELGSDISEMISDASQEEKNLLKQKLQMLTQKIS